MPEARGIEGDIAVGDLVWVHPAEHYPHPGEVVSIDLPAYLVSFAKDEETLGFTRLRLKLASRGVPKPQRPLPPPVPTSGSPERMKLTSLVESWEGGDMVTFYMHLEDAREMIRT